MISISYCVIASLILTVTAFLAYQYVVHRGDETKGWRMRFEYKPFLVFLISFLLALGILFFCYMKDPTLFVKPLMNSMVFLWLCILGYVDYREHIIPNLMILIGLIFWVVLVLIDVLIAKTPMKTVLGYSLVGGLVSGGFLFLVSFVSKSALGMGDVKMFTVIGLLYGLNNTYSILLFSVFVMAIVSVLLLILKKVTRKTLVPMAPFVVIGFFFGILAGI